jgi:hypothetical protein
MAFPYLCSLLHSDGSRTIATRGDVRQIQRHRVSLPPRHIDRPVRAARSLPHPVSVEILNQPLSSLLSHSPGLFTAATWFHRFFMRYSMLDYHRQVSQFSVASQLALARGLLSRH